MEKLTICTVSFKHQELIKINIDYVKKMNPGVEISWIIVEHTPVGSRERMPIGQLGEVEVIAGETKNFTGVASASYHHASGLNKALALVKTRYVLILDPDFYLLGHNWIKQVLSQMKEKQLSFFGAPYNPKRYMKYRYFPCVHCLFIDLQQIDRTQIDFTPKYDQSRLLNNSIKSQKEIDRSKLKGLMKLKTVLKHHLRLWLRRSVVIGSSRDTGYRLFMTFSQDAKYECVQPVFKPKLSDVNPKYLSGRLNCFLEKFLPDHLSYLPQKIDYYSQVSFGDLGYPDLFRRGWDEFIWQGKPFGFHLQGAKKDGTTADHTNDICFLQQSLENIASKHKDCVIFITLFEGVESKNILRSGVVAQLLQKKANLKIVLFVKNKEREEYYTKEFFNSRISYEIVSPQPPAGLNKIFSLLKFHFLQTTTTDIRAKMLAEERGVFYYFYSIILHRILARRLFVKIFRYLDWLLVKDITFDKYFEQYRPDAILLANLFEDFEISFLRSAKKYRVPSIGLINSWDRVTARCLLRLLPDWVIVFNDILKQEMICHNFVLAENVFVSGLPQYDEYFKSTPVDKEHFFKSIGLNPDDKLIVYSPIGGMFSNSDWDILDRLLLMNKSGNFGDRVKILVRFPPNDFIKDEDLNKRPGLIYQYPGKRFSLSRSTDWDMTNKEITELIATLHHMSLIVCYASSISIDAVVFDKPVINLNFEIKDNKKLSKSPTLFYPMTHYQKALTTGGIRLVANEQELIFWINKYLAEPKLDSEKRLVLMHRQCQFTDGCSAERIANFFVSKVK